MRLFLSLLGIFPVLVTVGIFFSTRTDLIPQSPIDPIVIELDPSIELSDIPLVQRNALTQGLQKLEFLPAPESFAVDPATGQVYMGLRTGAIVRSKTTRLGATAEDFEVVCAATGNPAANVDCSDEENELLCGRPLGMHFDAQHQLIVADSLGLLSVDVATGSVTVLSDHADDSSPLLFPNSLAISPVDGVVYFTDSSTRFRRNRVIYEVLEGRASGRLMAYHPHNRSTSSLVSNIHFPNGLAFIKNFTALLLTSTTRSSVYQYDITHHRLSLLRSDLPGIPDNITPRQTQASRAPTFYIGCTNLRSSLLLHLGRLPFVRRELARWLPSSWFLHFQPRFGLVLEIDENARVLSALTAERDSPSPLAFLSEAFEFDSKLLLGSFHNPYLAYIPSDNKPLA